MKGVGSREPPPGVDLFLSVSFPLRFEGALTMESKLTFFSTSLK